MAELPVHPRLAHMLLRGQALGVAALAADVAALLVERDIQSGGQRGGGADLALRLHQLQDGRGAGVQRVRQLARQFRSLLRAAAAPAAELDEQHALAALLAFAYPDRVARQRREGGGGYRLANGRAAQFGEPDPLMKESWLVIAELGSHQGQREERIYRAVALDPALFESALAEQVAVRDELEWDEREGVLRAERQRRVGELVLSREPLPTLDEARGKALLALVRRKGLELLAWTPELRQWQARIGLLRQLELDAGDTSDWPDVSDAALLARLEDWLLPYLGKVTRLAHFAQLDLAAMLATLLPWPLPRAWRSRHRWPSRCPPARASGWTTASSRRCWRCACRSCSAWPTRRVSPLAGRSSSCTYCRRRAGGHPGPGELLGQYLCRGEEGSEGALSQALLAGRSADRRAHRQAKPAGNEAQSEGRLRSSPAWRSVS